MSKMICGCMGLDEDAIKAAIKDGASSVDEVEEMTGAGSCCGACISDIQLVLDNN